MQSNIQVSEIPKHTSAPQFVLLNPRPTPARMGRGFQRLHPIAVQNISMIITEASTSEFLALDFETRGVDYSDPALEIIGLGLAWDSGSCYFDWQSLNQEQQDELITLIYTHGGLIAHNVYFDGGVLFSKYNAHPKWAACTYATYKHVANEGWDGQRWGLKDAMVDVLQWSDSNETQLDEWLVSNRYYIGNRLKLEDPAWLVHKFREGELRPDKAEMWRAPQEILGHYCVLDAEATYLLWTEHLRPVLQGFPKLDEYLHEEFLPLITRLIEQKCVGITVDRDGLLNRQAFLQGEIERMGIEFLRLPQVAPHIEAMEQGFLKELADREPEQYRMSKVRKEPNRLKVDGTTSKNWEKWKELQDRPREISKNWTNWQERWQAAVSGRDTQYAFNLNSGQQMRELLYTRMRLPVTVSTDSGEPAVSVKALRAMGELGNRLIERAWLVKELSYIDAYLNLSERDGKLHPSMRTPGPITGRLSSAEPNLQQISKTDSVMSLFVTSEPGRVWVDIDFAALESVVAAELSGDENLTLLYGNQESRTMTVEYLCSHLNSKNIPYLIKNGELYINE